MHHEGVGSVAHHVVFILINGLGFLCNHENQNQQNCPAAGS